MYSHATNSSHVLSEYSFGANNGAVISGTYSAALNRGRVYSDDSIAVNKGTSLGDNSFASGSSVAHGDNSFVANNTNIAVNGNSAVFGSNNRSTDPDVTAEYIDYDINTRVIEMSIGETSKFNDGDRITYYANNGTLNVAIIQSVDIPNEEITLDQPYDLYTGADNYFKNIFNNSVPANDLDNFVSGNHNNAGGNSSTVFGSFNNTENDNQLIIGKYNYNKSDTTMEIGWGTDDSTRYNIFEVYTNGVTTVPQATDSDIDIKGDSALITKGYADRHYVDNTGATAFTALTDTPNAYGNFAGYAVTVNQAEDGLEFTQLSIDNLSDVDTSTTAPSNGQVLKWDSVNSLWVPGADSAYVASLNDIGDVNVTGVTDNQIISWDDTAGEWHSIDLPNTATGLESIDEGNGTGWRLIGRDAANYGNIGNGSVDFSYSDAVSTSNGATGNNVFVTGVNTIANKANQFVAGKYNANQDDTIVEVGWGVDDTHRANAFEIYSPDASNDANRITAPGLSVSTINDDSTGNRDKTLITYEYFMDYFNTPEVRREEVVLDGVSGQSTYNIGSSNVPAEYDATLNPLEVYINGLRTSENYWTYDENNYTIDFDQSITIADDDKIVLIFNYIGSNLFDLHGDETVIIGDGQNTSNSYSYSMPSGYDPVANPFDVYINGIHLMQSEWSYDISNEIITIDSSIDIYDDDEINIIAKYITQV
jgi:hypothetical protein